MEGRAGLRARSSDAEVREAGKGPAPVVVFLGPTGAGKSFLASSFLPTSAPSNRRPLVAKPDQAAPTSAHVCASKMLTNENSLPHIADWNYWNL